MTWIKMFLEKYGLHSFLVPLFCITHSYLHYYGVIAPKEIFKIFIVLEIFFLLFFLCLNYYWKNTKANLIITTSLGSFYLFFGNIKEVLGKDLHLSFLAKYIIFLPLMLICIIAIVALAKKIKNYNSINLYLNSLFIVFIIADCVQLSSFNGIFASEKYGLLNNNIAFEKKQITNSADKKDIYYLLFDSYPNCELLKPRQPGVFSLDSFLSNRNFHVIQHSKCNYNNTAFSMDATLNMDYLERLKNPQHLTPMEYSKAMFDINQAAIFNYLEDRTYKIYNLSTFTVKNSAPVYKQNFLTMPPEEMFMYYTFWPCIKRDLFWNFAKYFREDVADYTQSTSFKNEKKLNEGKLNYNQTILDSVPKIAVEKSAGPKFVYAHFFLPHYPYFYDENGKKYSDTGIYKAGLIYNDQKFIGYVNYTNKKIVTLLEALLAKTGGNSIIIIQSDHGYRGFSKIDSTNNFKNISAFYFPDNSYKDLYDSMTNVNTFRIVLNKYFKEKMPVLQDTSIIMKD